MIPRSRQDAAIRASLSREGFSFNGCQPSRAATAATIRPLSTNAALDGANTRPRRSKGSKTSRRSSRAASGVRAPAASSCMTTAFMNVNGSARSRKARSSAAGCARNDAVAATTVVSRYHRRRLYTAEVPMSAVCRTKSVLAGLEPSTNVAGRLPRPSTGDTRSPRRLGPDERRVAATWWLADHGRARHFQRETG